MGVLGLLIPCCERETGGGGETDRLVGQREDEEVSAVDQEAHRHGPGGAWRDARPENGYRVKGRGLMLPKKTTTNSYKTSDHHLDQQRLFMQNKS